MLEHDMPYVDTINHYLISYGTGYHAVEDGENVKVFRNEKEFMGLFDAKGLLELLNKVSGSNQIYDIIEPEHVPLKHKIDESKVF